MPSKTTGKSARPVSLALQGGGAHAAFSWGVIDRLLQEDSIEIEAISATSGGAMLAAVVAQGMLEDGKEGARDALLKFWRKVSIAASLLPIRTNIVDKFLSNVGMDMSTTSIALDYFTKIFSPYQFNLFDLNPLRAIVQEMVDFEVINKQSPVALYINATHARTGKGKIFDHTELSLDAIMASCCLPYVFKTVEIDGEPYWDGSFSGCPSLAPLVNNAGATDIVLVQVHPNYVEEVPTAATDILDRMMEISFSSALLHELKAIELYNTMVESGKLKQRPATIHRVEAQDILLSLGRSSKLNTEWDFLMYLHDTGMQAASDWLEKLEQPDSVIRMPLKK